MAQIQLEKNQLRNILLDKHIPKNVCEAIIDDCLTWTKINSEPITVDRPLEKAVIGARAYNALARRRISTEQDLQNFVVENGKKELAKIRDIGEKTLKILEENFQWLKALP
jgi:hypothetical protein